MTDKFKTNVLVFLQHVLKIDLKIRFLIDLIDWAQMNQIGLHRLMQTQL